MKAIVFFKEFGRISLKTIEAETKEDACKKAFDMEFLLCDALVVTKVWFNNEAIPWNSTAAHYYFAKGRGNFAEFIEWCNSPEELETEKEACNG